MQKYLLPEKNFQFKFLTHNNIKKMYCNYYQNNKKC